MLAIIVDEIQEVYRLQGVRIDDKHIEVIVSQMLKKVEVVDPGDSMYVVGDSMTKGELEEVNEKLLAEEEAPVVANPMLLGITKASLSTDSSFLLLRSRNDKSSHPRGLGGEARWTSWAQGKYNYGGA